MSDVVWQALIAGCVSVLLAWMQIRNEIAARQVKQTLAEQTAHTDDQMRKLKVTTEATHTLVNSAMSAQLKITAVALRRVAEMTGHPEDVAAAELAEVNYRAQEAKQCTVDREEG